MMGKRDYHHRSEHVILCHLRQESMDEIDHLRHTDVNRALYRKRQETIECVFAEAKEQHGMRWTRYLGVKNTYNNPSFRLQNEGLFTI